MNRFLGRKRTSGEEDSEVSARAAEQGGPAKAGRGEWALPPGEHYDRFLDEDVAGESPSSEEGEETEPQAEDGSEPCEVFEAPEVFCVAEGVVKLQRDLDAQFWDSRSRKMYRQVLVNLRREAGGMKMLHMLARSESRDAVADARARTQEHALFARHVRLAYAQRFCNTYRPYWLARQRAHAARLRWLTGVAARLAAEGCSAATEERLLADLARTEACLALAARKLRDISTELGECRADVWRDPDFGPREFTRQLCFGAPVALGPLGLTAKHVRVYGLTNSRTFEPALTVSEYNRIMNALEPLVFVPFVSSGGAGTRAEERERRSVVAHLKADVLARPALRGGTRAMASGVELLRRQLRARRRQLRQMGEGADELLCAKRGLHADALAVRRAAKLERREGAGLLHRLGQPGFVQALRGSCAGEVRLLAELLLGHAAFARVDAAQREALAACRAQLAQHTHFAALPGPLRAQFAADLQPQPDPETAQAFLAEGGRFFFRARRPDRTFVYFWEADLDFFWPDMRVDQLARVKATVTKVNGSLLDTLVLQKSNYDRKKRERCLSDLKNARNSSPFMTVFRAVSGDTARAPDFFTRVLGFPFARALDNVLDLLRDVVAAAERFFLEATTLQALCERAARHESQGLVFVFFFDTQLRCKTAAALRGEVAATPTPAPCFTTLTAASLLVLRLKITN